MTICFERNLSEVRRGHGNINRGGEGGGGKWGGTLTN